MKQPNNVQLEKISLGIEYGFRIKNSEERKKITLDDFKSLFTKDMINKMPYDDYNILELSILNSRYDITKYLLTFSGWDLNHQNYNGETILQYISQNRSFNFEIVKALLNYGNIDTNIVDRWGNNPIHTALYWKSISWRDHSAIKNYYRWLKALHDAGFKLTKSSLVLINRYDDFKALDIFNDELPKYHSNTSKKFKNLIESYINGNKKSLNYFKDHFDKNMLEMNYYGFSLIQLVVKYCSADIVRYVLTYSNNIDLNYQHPYFKTTVFQMIASKKVFNYKLACELLNYGFVDTEVLDIFGENAVDTALREKPQPFQKSELEENYYNWLKKLCNIGFPKTDCFVKITKRIRDSRSIDIFKNTKKR